MAHDEKKHPLTYPFAHRNGEIVHASELTGDDVARDKAADVQYHCINPACADTVMTLKAVGSSKMQQHFAHDNATCGMSRETAIHIAAKRVLRESRRILLPSLPATHKGGPAIQPSRNARWREAVDEAVILGRWRADVLMSGEINDPFFTIQEHGDPSPLVIEIVVTSAISKRKVDAVQTHSWRMIEIGVDADADLTAIEELILDGQNRKWLAHPTWSEGIAQERRRQDEERLLQEAAEAARIDEIMARIRAHRAPQWNANEELTLAAFLTDHGLHQIAGKPCGYDHWMAGDPTWWHAVVLREIVRDVTIHGTGRAIPMAKALLATVDGFVMPIPPKADAALVAALGVAPKGLGAPLKTMTSFLMSLEREGLLCRHQARFRPSSSFEEIILRNHEIDRRVKPWIVETYRTPGHELIERLHSWKSGPFDHDTRRSAILSGGSRYYALIIEADRLLREARERYAEETAHARHRAGQSRPPDQQDDYCKSDLKTHLSAVHERHLPPESVDQPTAIISSFRDEVAQKFPKPQAIDDPYDISDVDLQNTVVERYQPEKTDWVAELTILIQRSYSKSAKERTRAAILAHVCVNSTHPRLGAKPADLCKNQEGFERCRQALGV